MSSEERSTLLQLVIGVIVNIYILIRLSQLFDSGALDGPDAIQVWAMAMLWVIGLSIVFGIIVAIIGSILFAVILNEPDPSFVVDERDRMIANTGLKITMGFVSTGFLGMIAALAFGIDPLICLIGLMLTYSVGSTIGEAGKLARYRMSI